MLPLVRRCGALQEDELAALRKQLADLEAAKKALDETLSKTKADLDKAQADIE